jgi:uncharacterized protein (DUF488 family)
MPYSKYTPQFNVNGLKRFLNSNGLHYMFLGEELGARREDRSLYTIEGYLDFEKVSKTHLFNLGIERIETGIEKGCHIALMCAEKDPIDCHRSILVAREFHKLNYSVNNILENGKIQTQEDLEKRLLDMYFPDRMQLTLFDVEERKSDSELIEQAYRLRNKDMGYSIAEEKENIPNEVIYHRFY